MEVGMAGPNTRARATSALFQSNFGRQGNFELVITNNQSTRSSGSGSGDLFPVWRNNDAPGWPWAFGSSLTFGDSAGSGSPATFPVPVGLAFRFPCWFQGTNRHYHGVCVRGTQVKYFARAISPGWLIPVTDVSGASNCSGAPALIQSFFGSQGNFELIVPVSSGGMDHYWSNNNAGLPHRPFPTSAPANMPVWGRAFHFGRGNRVEAVRIIHSDYGNLEVIALEQVGTSRELAHYWQSGPGGAWNFGSVLPGSGEVSGTPGFIQSTFGVENGNGNLEIVAPARGGGLMHWFRPRPEAGFIRAPNVDAGGRRVSAVHLFQSNYGPATSPHGNFEVIAETGGQPYGYGSLIAYWRDNQAGVWGGPLPVTPA